MPSLQSYILGTIMRYAMTTTDLSVPMVQQRAQVDASARMMIFPRGVARSPVSVGGLRAEWLVPRTAHSDCVMLYVHGGGYVMCSLATHRAPVARIAQVCGLPALLLEYRLAPEHEYPAALDDVAAAYEFLLAAGFASERIVLAGESAGGGLILSLLLKLKQEGRPMPACALALSAVTDLTLAGETIKTNAARDWINERVLNLVHLYHGAQDARLPLISPLYGEWSNMPPVLLQVGGLELLLSDSERLAHTIESAQGTVLLSVHEGVGHGFQILAPFVPEANKALEEMREFIGQYLPQKGEGNSTQGVRTF